MGFRSAFMPAESTASAGQSKVLDGLRVIEVDHVRRALDLLALVREEPRGDAGGRPFTLH